MLTYNIEEDYDGARLDRFLRKKLPDVALTQIFKYIRIGKIKVNSKKSKENYKLKLGDKIDIYIENIENKKIEFLNLSKKEIEDIEKSIVYENENILVYNKQANEVMHKGSSHEYGLVEKLKSYLKTEDFNFANRIDKLTSGLVLGCKNLNSLREISEEIRNRNIDKKYYILVEGNIEKDDFSLVTYLKKEEEKVIESNVFKEGYKKSTSHFKVIKKNKNYTLLEGDLETGRTHQLRVQLSNLGYPIVGDTKYSKTKENKLYLFSHYLKINKLNIEIDLEVPEEFLTKLNKK